jgi:hypothetical protein
VGQLFDAGGPATVRVTGFVDGFEMYAEADVTVYLPTVEIMSEESLIAGNTYRVTWPLVVGESPILFTLSFSPDGGYVWDDVAAGLVYPYYNWLVPEVATDRGMLRVRCLDGGTETRVYYSCEFSVVGAAGIDPRTRRDAADLLVSPNPSRASFDIRFSCPGDRGVSLDIYSVEGRLVRELMDEETPAGIRSVTWHGDDDVGSQVAAGAYFAVLDTGERVLVRKLIVER